MDTKPNYLQTQPYLQNRFKQVGRKLAFQAITQNEGQAWRRKTLKTLKKLTGYDTMRATDPMPRIMEEIDLGNIVRQKIVIQTEPKILLSAFVLIPKQVKPPYSVVIAPHGHVSGGKLAVAGCREIPEIAKTIEVYNYDYGVKFAEAGFIVFCPDARGFGERQENASKGNPLSSSCQWINNMAYPLGQTVTGMWAWDLHRLIDYVASRKDCRADRIGCAGLSGGGLQTLWATALDPRIRCAVISGYLYGYKESLLDQHTNCSCNYVPHLYEYVDMGDIASLIAPRPLLVETGTEDGLNGASGLGNVVPQIRTMRKAYRVFGSPKKLYHDVFEGAHRWHGIKAIPWMKKHLM